MHAELTRTTGCQKAISYYYRRLLCENKMWKNVISITVMIMTYPKSGKKIPINLVFNQQIPLS